MKMLQIPPFPEGLFEAKDRMGHRKQGDEPHKAAKEAMCLSSDWKLYADGQEVPVYAAPITRGGPHSFARVSYEGDEPIQWLAVRDGGAKKVEIRPISYNMTGEVSEEGIRFETNRCCHVTLLVDDDIQQPLTVSVDPVRPEVKPEDIKGLYFGPGVHYFDYYDFEDGDTVYLAAGAVVVAKPHPEDEEPIARNNWAGNDVYRNFFQAIGKKNVTLDGPGVLDFSLLHWHERNPVIFGECKNVLVRDVTIVNVPHWTIHITGSEEAEVDNVKLFGYRENSDGIDITSSENAYVHDCFIRTGDDAVGVKALYYPPRVGGKNILCERCVVWNDKVRCFGIPCESRNDISDVTFRDCDVIASYANWTLELGSLVVYISDHGTISNIMFDDIRIDHEVHLATHVMIAKDFWSKDKDPGQIRNITFRNITVRPKIGSRVSGYDAEHTSEGIHYENFSVNGVMADSLESAGVQVCDYTKDVTVTRTYKTEEIHVRDPFVLPVGDRYYLYGTRGQEAWNKNFAVGFDTYVSDDLETWTGPIPAFRPPEGFWSKAEYWAPEVHEYKGAYYMFASFRSESRRRGTQIFRAEKPEGPFLLHSDGPVTPAEWECLDGTLFVDEDGKPWMVFCHEWVQVHDGEMCAIQLTDDLKAPVGEPILLFHASEPVWAKDVDSDAVTAGPAQGKTDYVTDGPFMYRTKGGKLLMIWSSFAKTGYVQAVASSESGTIAGPWRHEPLLFEKDGGHGMIFRTKEGDLKLIVHAPNNWPNERPHLIDLVEEDDQLKRC
ncbi:MAG: hypothetical protein E7324_05930 [Clostridiales bacterium]|nr:hypothetical protein [Clostridiales bacterium]